MLNLCGRRPANDAIRGPQILETHLIYAWFLWAKSEVFPLRISSINVIKSAGNCEFGHIFWKNPQYKTFFLPLDRQYVIYIIFEFRSSSSLVFHKKLILKFFYKTRKEVSAWCKSGSRTPGPPLKFKSGTPGPSSKFKSGTLGPPTKFKSGTPSAFFNEFIFFQDIFSLFYLFIFVSFLNKMQKNINCE